MSLIAAGGLCTLSGFIAPGVGAATAPPTPLPVRPDLEVISVAADHTQLAPDSTFTLTFVVRSGNARTGPFSAGVYYAAGAASSRGVPRNAVLLGSYPADRGLAKGETVSFSTQVRVPKCDVCGAHTVYVVADPGNATAESIESNNFRAVTLDVARDHLPDLRVDSVAISPDRGSTSDKVAVRATVRNASRYFAEGPFRVSVYCSSNAEPTASDRRLYSFMVPSLGPSQTIGVDRAIPLEPGCPVRALSTWIGVLADDQDAVRESNEENDGRSAPYWAFRAPDLTTRTVSVSAASGPVGSRVSVSYRVSNQGGSAAGPLRTAVYLAKTEAPSALGTELDAASLPSLAANADTGLIEHAVTVPAVPRGAYFLRVVVDPDGNNGELRKRNNFRAVRFEVTDTNLTDVFFSASPKNVVPGEGVTLRIAVRNTGRDVASPFKVAFYYSDDPRFDAERDVGLGEFDVSTLAAGAATPEKKLTVAVPRDAREGYRFLLAVVDYTDRVAETDERDNVALAAIHVGAP